MARNVRQWMITAVAVIAFGTASTVFAAPGAEEQGPWFGPRMRGHARAGLLPGLGQLGLSDAQRQQIRDIVQSHRDEFRAVGEQLRSLRLAERQAVTAPVVDEALIRARVAEVAAVRADAAVLRASVRNEVWQVLTLEQQQKAAQLEAERDQRRQERIERLRQRFAPRQ